MQRKKDSWPASCLSKTAATVPAPALQKRILKARFQRCSRPSYHQISLISLEIERAMTNVNKRIAWFGGHASMHQIRACMNSCTSLQQFQGTRKLVGIISLLSIPSISACWGSSFHLLASQQLAGRSKHPQRAEAHLAQRQKLDNQFTGSRVRQSGQARAHCKLGKSDSKGCNPSSFCPNVDFERPPEQQIRRTPNGFTGLM